jgi:hypothetical protein
MEAYLMVALSATPHFGLGSIHQGTFFMELLQLGIPHEQASDLSDRCFKADRSIQKHSLSCQLKQYLCYGQEVCHCPPWNAPLNCAIVLNDNYEFVRCTEAHSVMPMVGPNTVSLWKHVTKDLYQWTQVNFHMRNYKARGLGEIGHHGQNSKILLSAY